MLRRHIEGFEVVVIVLDLGPFDHHEPEPREDVLDPLAEQAERMPVAERGPAAGKRHVHGMARRACPHRRVDPRRQRRVDAVPERVGELAQARTLLGGNGPEGLQQRRNEPPLPRQIAVAYRAELRLGAGAREILIELLAE
jgi:hypothetical protein